MYKKYFALLIFLMLSGVFFGQSSLSGKVINEKGKGLFGVNLIVLGTQSGAVSNESGAFEINQILDGNYNLEVSILGYKKRTIPVVIQKNKSVFLIITMSETSEALDEVVVQGKTQQQQKREAPIKIEVIELSKISERASTLTEVINQTSGVKVRQRAGVGSPTLININGLQENAIRFFKNGIPSDYLGRAFQLGVIPTSLISNVEIYKGVLPIELGADALGGAINIETKGHDKNSLTTSYEIGSFNTHIGNIDTNYNIPNTKMHIGLSSYYIHSDNDYAFDGPVLNADTQNFKEERVKRFHDGIDTYFVQGNFGVHDTKFADVLNLDVAYFNWDKEIQTGISINTPIGEATNQETNKILSLTYEKTFNTNFLLKLFSAYSKKNEKAQDISNNKYNWLGEIISNDNFNSGEIDSRKRDQNIDEDNFVGRLYAKYTLTKNLNFKLSSTYTNIERVGTDPFQEVNMFTGVQPITIPSKYKKIISGAGIGAKFLNGKLTNEFTLKSFYLATESVNNDSEATLTKKNNQSFGWGNSVKYKFDNEKYVRVSFENTTRIPEAIEYFGDNLFNLSNANLEPEESKNLNLGFYTNLNKNKTLFIDVNTFYRDTENFIRRLPIGFIFSRNENTDTQITKGIETNFKANFNNNLKASIAITYQDLRRVDTNGSALEGSRTPNTPYFFTNLNAIKSYNNPFGWPLDLSIYGNYNYTEQYLLRPVTKILEPGLFERDLGFTDLIIPEQHQVDFGITVKLEKLPISINTEIVNITNSKLFDEFRIQKPLRSFRLKITYKI